MVISKDVEAAVIKLLDIEAIKKLKAQYCFCVDEGRWDDLEDLFTEDAVCDYGFFGRYEGKSQVLGTFFRQLVATASSFSAHMIHNAVIDVEDGSAKAKWYLTAPTTVQNRAIWTLGVYQDEFVKVNGTWKISAINFSFKYYTPFEDGWVKTPMWAPAA